MKSHNQTTVRIVTIFQLTINSLELDWSVRLEAHSAFHLKYSELSGLGKKKHRKTVHGSTTACTLRSIPTKKLQILSIIQTIPLLPPCFSSQKHLAKTMVKTQWNKIVIDCSLLHARAIVHVRNTLWMGLVETLQSKIVVFQDLS